MTFHLRNVNNSSLPSDLEPGTKLATNDISSRMRSGIVWTGGGLLTLAGTILLAAESLIARRMVAPRLAVARPIDLGSGGHRFRIRRHG